MKNRSTISIIVLLLLALLALVLIFTYGAYSIASRNVRIESESVEIRRGLGNELVAQSARSAQIEYARELASLEVSVVEEDELVPLIESIENAGRSLGLDTRITAVSSDKPDGGTEVNNPEKIRIAVESKGEWQPALLYLRTLESLPTRVDMEEVNFTKEESERGEGSWTLRTTLSVYVFK